jgi:hypothetical protein
MAKTLLLSSLSMHQLLQCNEEDIDYISYSFEILGFPSASITENPVLFEKCFTVEWGRDNIAKLGVDPLRIGWLNYDPTAEIPVMMAYRNTSTERCLYFEVQ